MMEIVVWHAAAADLEAAYTWYEQRRAGLGEEFARAVEERLRLIAERPLIYAVVHRQTRRALLARFPYGIFYVVQPQRIVVVACFHARRAPRAWKARR